MPTSPELLPEDMDDFSGIRVVFWGTPAPAAVCLDALVDAGAEVTGVITQPDKPVGRKKTLTPPPVAHTAGAHAIPVFQPERLRDTSVDDVLAGWSPEICVVVAYGKIIPARLLNIPDAFVNLHFSLLPAYRGAAPVQRAVMDGCTHTGVTVQHLAPELDSGDIILQETVDIGRDETSGELLDRCTAVGAPLLLRAVALLRAGAAPRTPQDHAAATYAPKMTKDDGLISWTDSAFRIHNCVRACSPWPGTLTFLGSLRLKILSTRLPDVPPDNSLSAPGGVLVRASRVYAAAGDGWLELCSVQPAGKRAMPASAFAAGHDIDGAVLTPAPA